MHTDETDSTMLDKAVKLFEGDVKGAKRWLRAPKLALGGKTPLDLASTETGARQVEDLIGRLEHGVFTETKYGPDQVCAR